MTIKKALPPLVISLALFGCASAGSSSSSPTSRADQCSESPAYSSARSHDEAREAHQGGQPEGSYETMGHSSTNAAERTPGWWGQGDRGPCGDEEPSSLSGPLLLDSDEPEADEPEADEPL